MAKLGTFLFVVLWSIIYAGLLVGLTYVLVGPLDKPISSTDSFGCSMVVIVCLPLSFLIVATIDDPKGAWKLLKLLGRK